MATRAGRFLAEEKKSEGNCALVKEKAKAHGQLCEMGQKEKKRKRKRMDAGWWHD